MTADDFYDSLAPASASASPSLDSLLDPSGYESAVRSTWDRLAVMQAESDAKGSSNFLARWGRTLTEHPGWNALPIFGQLIAGPSVTALGDARGLSGVHFSPRAKAYLAEVNGRSAA